MTILEILEQLNERPELAGLLKALMELEPEDLEEILPSLVNLLKDLQEDGANREELFGLFKAFLDRLNRDY